MTEVVVVGVSNAVFEVVEGSFVGVDLDDGGRSVGGDGGGSVGRGGCLWPGNGNSNESGKGKDLERGEGGYKAVVGRLRDFSASKCYRIFFLFAQKVHNYLGLLILLL